MTERTRISPVPCYVCREETLSPDRCCSEPCREVVRQMHEFLAKDLISSNFYPPKKDR